MTDFEWIFLGWTDSIITHCEMIIQNIKKLLFPQVYDIQIINRCRVIMEGQIHQIT